MSDSKKRGHQAELAVGNYLKQKGFTILCYNYHKPFGEIDIIAQNIDFVLFVEVKMKTKQYFDPSLVITLTKQKKICRVAQDYLTKKPFYTTHSCRFDVALVSSHSDSYTITYLENAFTCPYSF